jgi:hypothetical protein
MGTQEPPNSGGEPAETGAAEANVPPSKRDVGDDAEPVPLNDDADPVPSSDPGPGRIVAAGSDDPTGDPVDHASSTINPAGAEARTDPTSGAQGADPAAGTGGAATPDEVGPGWLELPEPDRKLPERMPETRHGRNLPPDEPAARFHARERPQRYATGIGQRQPTRPLDPIQPYMPPPVARRRRSDWPVMIFVMVIAGLIMVGCCLAGFALYTAYNPFTR